MPSLPPPAASDQPPTWPQLRRLGAGFWLRDRALLASTAERLAKQQFAARRNADDCALLYSALGKRSVLQVSGRRLLLFSAGEESLFTILVLVLRAGRTAGSCRLCPEQALGAEGV